MAIKKHKAQPDRFCPICGKKHTRSEHLSHGKGSFSNFPSRKTKTKKNKSLSHDSFIRLMNKGRKKKGLPPIPLKKKKKR